ncbi:hypothetical protein MVES_003786 [Malassezia vespertilionis]|uniref:Translation initiation factor IF2/IF5 domain-containing protein n=1 Tax=Malassezia vespertilionis TaxID=2020962 RepID=A0A2N1J6Y4_9BASI|nr:hypothetical protein MVES_003786 [Malassezia vespertilionis]
MSTEELVKGTPPAQESAQDVSDLFGGMKKKSSKKKKLPMDLDLDAALQDKETPAPLAEAEPAKDSVVALEEPDKESSVAPEEPALDATPAEGDEFDFGELKKKKKKKKAAFDIEEFEKELGGQVDQDNADDDLDDPFAPEKSDDTTTAKTDDVEAWLGSDRDYTYQELLGRFFKTLRVQNPALSGEKKKYTMVPPVVQRDGSKKTVFANVLEICKRMHRQPDHVIQYLFTELGTVGSIDGSQRLVIRGRFQPKQIENVLRRYIVEYVTCKTCRSPNTLLTKENRIYFMTCESCGSQRSVSAIKTGFQAQTGKRSKMRQQ